MATFAIIGFGELGSQLARGLTSAGAEVRVFTRRDAAKARAREPATSTDRASLSFVSSLEAAVSGATAVVAAVPAAASAEVTAAVAAALEPGVLYVDPTPTLPADKAHAAELIAARGAAYVDAAVLGTVIVHGSRVPMLVAGPGASAWCDLVTPLGMSVSVIPGAPGQASLIKLLRSVYLKGRDALIVETLLAARRYGAEDAVLASIEPGEGEAFADVVTRVMCSLAMHADRRAQELAASARIVEEAGVEPLVTAAAVERLRRLADIGLRDHFRGERPDDLEAVLAAIDAATAE